MPPNMDPPVSPATLLGLLIAAVVVAATVLWLFSKKLGWAATAARGSGSSSGSFAAIRDQYETIPAVQAALRSAGLESSQLIVGIDFTQSNTWTGATSFGGRCLHDVVSGEQNPYQRAISIIGRTLSAFDDDGMIPAFGFGDKKTADKSVFQLGRGPCAGFDEVLRRYAAAVPTLQLSGPTSFAPLIRKAIEVVRLEKQYTILLIVADGQVTDVAETERAIVDASSFPLSIVVIGVGDGPFGLMEDWDDKLPARKFDNLQFVNFTRIDSMRDLQFKDATFAIAALQEIPEQFKAVQRLRLM